MRNAQILMKSFLGFCSFHEVRKAGLLSSVQGQYKNKKRPYVARKLCATQGLYFLSSLGFPQNIFYCPFSGIRGCRVFPKTFCVLGNLKYPPKGKFSHSLHSHLFLSFFFSCPSLFLPRTSFSFPGNSMALGSVYHD